MICRSCGCIYFKENRQKICRTCYSGGKTKEKVFYTKKIWDKFSWGTQTKLSKQYDIIFKYEKPMKLKVKEKLKGVFKRSDKAKRKERREKLFKAVKKIIKGTTSKSGSSKMAKLSRALNDSTHNTSQLISTRREPQFAKKRKHSYQEPHSDHNFEGLLGKSDWKKSDWKDVKPTDYSGLISKRKDIKL